MPRLSAFSRLNAQPSSLSCRRATPHDLVQEGGGIVIDDIVLTDELGHEIRDLLQMWSRTSRRS